MSAARTSDQGRRPRLWAELTAPEIGAAARAGDVVLLPIGAIEQHGPHLPVEVDIRGPLATAEEISRLRPWAIVAPPVWWGLSGEHRGFPGMLTLRPQTFYELLFDLCDSIVASGFTRICLLVGHASNRPFVTTIVSQFMQQRGVRLLQLNYLFFGAETFGRIRTTSGGDAHAGELETSVMLHLRPELVGPLESAPRHPVDPVRDYGLSAAGSDLLRPGQATIGFDLAETFPDGVMGDPTVATAETGRQVFEAIVAGVVAVLDEYHEI